ncbi:hypothetical protein DERF_012257 [Dermatophagoides farinae]|uniref:Secreted protein n=1 Tax=Dermatophagoides farinae TaxID=6954 RepID=A0A922L1J1_DERFA|nr:hypothetical protein DERF_012257 [Dermatophagoides farinae]
MTVRQSVLFILLTLFSWSQPQLFCGYYNNNKLHTLIDKNNCFLNFNCKSRSRIQCIFYEIQTRRHVTCFDHQFYYLTKH